MSERNPSITQADAPQLLADLIRDLTLIGAPIGLLDFAATIIPTFIIGARGLNITAVQPTILVGEIESLTSTGLTAGLPAFDTSPKAAGTYDIWASITVTLSAINNNTISFINRNAANSADLFTLPYTIPDQGGQYLLGAAPLRFSVVLEDLSTLQFRPALTDAAAVWAAWIIAHRRDDIT